MNTRFFYPLMLNHIFDFMSRSVYLFFLFKQFFEIFGYIVASLLWLLSAGVWLFQAINWLEIGYCVLAVIHAILALVNIILYEKGKKTATK